jgi:hypothetical protein
MLTWAEIILTALKVINVIMGAINREKWIQAGKDAEIAAISAEIMRKTLAGKTILERVNALSDDAVDAELRGLEPK